MASSVEKQATGPWGGASKMLAVSIERHPHPTDAEDLSETDAAWPQRLRRIVRAGLTHWDRPALIDTAELLLTELATNALRHGQGCDITVRVFLTVDRCVIEVADGSPTRPQLRNAGPEDEGGRGLFLVEALAQEWGVSPDGTTTWCTLPLTEGPEEMQSVAATAPVLRKVQMDIPANNRAPGLARLQGRTQLTVAEWPGDQYHAVDALHVLVDNAVRHALTHRVLRPFGVCLSFTEAHELLIDVTDPLPEFPNFGRAVTHGSGGGLRDLARGGVELSWFLVGEDSKAKTVRAVLRPTGMVAL